MKPYQKLASIYNKNWGEFSLKYLKIINAVKKKSNLKPKSALDIACGTGNLIGCLANKGLDVVGTDISPEMIKVAKRNFPKGEFYVQDMYKLSFNKKFDLILCAFDSINYLMNLKEIQQTFKKVKRHLKPKGIFIFDSNTPYLYLTKHKRNYEKEISGVKFKHICNYNKKTREVKTIFEFEDGRKEIHIQRAYPKKEILSALRKEGFQILGVYDSFELGKPNRKSRRLFYVAGNKKEMR